MPAAYADVNRFRTLVEERFGLCLSEQTDHVSKVVRQRMQATGCQDFAAYETLLTSSSESSRELRAIVEVLTVGETYFFRNGDHFRALIEHVIPERLRDARGRPVRVLSAGCASGEEPYTIAILLREHFADLGPSDVSVVAVDVNPAAIAKARRGRYSSWSLRETPWPIRDKYFKGDGTEVVLAEDIRAMVTLEERNLFESDPRFWAPTSFDVVFCRNVVIYFGPEKLSEAIARLTDVLASRGFLFLGHSESLRGMTDDFDLLNTHNTFYYQRRDPSLPRPANGPGGSWTASIERASWRVRQLTSRPPPLLLGDEALLGSPSGTERASVRPDPLQAAAASIDLATELYRQERFAEALDLLRAQAPAVQNESGVQLLMAAILTNQGELEAAEAICRCVLTLDDLNAGAHYLTALARQRAGDPEGAVRHDQMAAYLDATFAMPRLHMGMLARHAGDLATARRELSQAMTLLGREDAARIKLFGGGFAREALVRLCRAELQAAGGKP